VQVIERFYTIVRMIFYRIDVLLIELVHILKFSKLSVLRINLLVLQYQ